MNKLRQLTKEDIINHYLDKPILVEYSSPRTWYLVTDNNRDMPVYLLSRAEVELYELDESYIEGIEVVGTGIDVGFLLWVHFEKEDGWKAYGYE